MSVDESIAVVSIVISSIAVTLSTISVVTCYMRARQAQRERDRKLAELNALGIQAVMDAKKKEKR